MPTAIEIAELAASGSVDVDPASPRRGDAARAAGSHAFARRGYWLDGWFWDELKALRPPVELSQGIPYGHTDTLKRSGLTQRFVLRVETDFVRFNYLHRVHPAIGPIALLLLSLWLGIAGGVTGHIAIAAVSVPLLSLFGVIAWRRSRLAQLVKHASKSVEEPAEHEEALTAAASRYATQAAPKPAAPQPPSSLLMAAARRVNAEASAASELEILYSLVVLCLVLITGYQPFFVFDVCERRLGIATAGSQCVARVSALGTLPGIVGAVFFGLRCIWLAPLIGVGCVSLVAGTLLADGDFQRSEPAQLALGWSIALNVAVLVVASIRERRVRQLFEDHVAGQCRRVQLLAVRSRLMRAAETCAPDAFLPVLATPLSQRLHQPIEWGSAVVGVVDAHPTTLSNAPLRVTPRFVVALLQQCRRQLRAKCNEHSVAMPVEHGDLLVVHTPPAIDVGAASQAWIAHHAGRLVACLHDFASQPLAATRLIAESAWYTNNLRLALETTESETQTVSRQSKAAYSGSGAAMEQVPSAVASVNNADDEEAELSEAPPSSHSVSMVAPAASAGLEEHPKAGVGYGDFRLQLGSGMECGVTSIAQCEAFLSALGPLRKAAPGEVRLSAAAANLFATPLQSMAIVGGSASSALQQQPFSLHADMTYLGAPVYLVAALDRRHHALRSTVFSSDDGHSQRSWAESRGPTAQGPQRQAPRTAEELCGVALLATAHDVLEDLVTVCRQDGVKTQLTCVDDFGGPALHQVAVRGDRGIRARVAKLALGAGLGRDPSRPLSRKIDQLGYADHAVVDLASTGAFVLLVAVVVVVDTALGRRRDAPDEHMHVALSAVILAVAAIVAFVVTAVEKLRFSAGEREARRRATPEYDESDTDAEWTHRLSRNSGIGSLVVEVETTAHRRWAVVGIAAAACLAPFVALCLARSPVLGPDPCALTAIVAAINPARHAPHRALRVLVGVLLALFGATVALTYPDDGLDGSTGLAVPGIALVCFVAVVSDAAQRRQHALFGATHNLQRSVLCMQLHNCSSMLRHHLPATVLEPLFLALAPLAGGHGDLEAAPRDRPLPPDARLATDCSLETLRTEAYTAGLQANAAAKALGLDPIGESSRHALYGFPRDVRVPSWRARIEPCALLLSAPTPAVYTAEMAHLVAIRIRVNMRGEGRADVARALYAMAAGHRGRRRSSAMANDGREVGRAGMTGPLRSLAIEHTASGSDAEDDEHGDDDDEEPFADPDIYRHPLAPLVSRADPSALRVMWVRGDDALVAGGVDVASRTDPLRAAQCSAAAAVKYARLVANSPALGESHTALSGGVCRVSVLGDAKLSVVLHGPALTEAEDILAAAPRLRGSMAFAGTGFRRLHTPMTRAALRQLFERPPEPQSNDSPMAEQLDGTGGSASDGAATSEMDLCDSLGETDLGDTLRELRATAKVPDLDLEGARRHQAQRMAMLRLRELRKKFGLGNRGPSEDPAVFARPQPWRLRRAGLIGVSVVLDEGTNETSTTSRAQAAGA